MLLADVADAAAGISDVGSLAMLFFIKKHLLRKSEVIKEVNT